MSTLLEQAIVDAKALKDAAVKNAENLVIEKYSKEIKDAVELMLEQEDPMAGAADPFASAGPMVPPGAAPTDPAAAQPSGPEDMTDPMAGFADTASDPTAEAEAPEVHKVIKSVPDAFITEDDNKPITINLDELHSQINEAMDNEGLDLVDSAEDRKLMQTIMEALDAAPSASEMDDEVDEHSWDADTDGLLGEMEMAEEDEFTNDPDPGFLRGEDDLEAMIMEDDEEMLQGVENPMYENLSNEDLNSLLEMLGEEEDTLDVNSLRDGWPGATEEAEEEAQLMADLNDKLDKENKDLKKENKGLRNARLSSEEENIKLREALSIFKDKLEEVNTSNAKLLYINQTLGNASLNERQKQRVVEAISRSETANEAKTIYETLQSTVGTQDKASLPQSLSEAVNRKSSLLVAGRKATVTRENDSPVYDRMQRLAGLK